MSLMPERSLNPIPPRSVLKDLAGHFQKVQVPGGQLGAVDTPDITMCGGNKKDAAGKYENPLEDTF